MEAETEATVLSGEFYTQEFENKPGMVGHTFTPGLERQRQVYPRIRDQPGPHSKFQDIQGCIERSCLKRIKNKNKKQKEFSNRGLERWLSKRWESSFRGSELSSGC